MKNNVHTLDRRRLIKTASLGGMVALSPLAFPGWTSASPATPVSTTLADRLEPVVSGVLHSLSIPGACVHVDDHGAGRWTSALGVSDLESGSPMTPDMHMRIGSITKTMTATVVLQLIGEGSLALDDTIVSVLPDLPDFPYAEQITIRQLLSMTSGIFDVLKDESIFARIMNDPTRAWTPEEMVGIAFEHEAAFAPGEDVGYSNTNYMLLGMVIEDVTGQPASKVFEDRLFTPLGLEHTSLPLDSTLPSPFAHGYSVDPSGQTDDLIDWTMLNATVAWTGGGVVSTVGDLHTWLTALLDGSMIGESLQRERITFAPIRPGYEYGLGIANYDGMIGHEGSILGYNSFAGHNPDIGRTVIVLANLDPSGSDEDAANAIATAIREELSAQGLSGDVMDHR